MKQSRGGQTIFRSRGWSTTCTSYLNLSSICIETAFFTGTLNQKIFCLPEKQLSWQTLAVVEVFTKTSHSPSISQPGGTEHRSAYSLTAITVTKWTFGA